MTNNNPIICVFDTETTGLIDNHSLKLDKQPEVIEFACKWLEWRNLDNELARYSVFVRPSKFPLSEETKKHTPIRDPELEDAASFDQVADKISALLEEANIVSGHNLSFDMEMMDLEYERLARKVVWPKTRICTVEQTIHITGNRIGLGALHAMFTGKPHDSAHRAMADVDATITCLRHMRQRGWI